MEQLPLFCLDILQNQTVLNLFIQL